MNRPKNLPIQILYNPNTRLGSKEPYVLTMSSKWRGRFPLYWHISDTELYRLEAGRGKLLGRQEWGPWHILVVYNYRVVGFYRELSDYDKKRLKELEELLNCD